MASLRRPSSGDEVEDHENDRDHQEDMNQSAPDVRDESEDPEQEQETDEGPNDVDHPCVLPLVRRGGGG